MKILAATVLSAFAWCGNLSASAVSGTFNITGTITVTLSTITWTSDAMIGGDTTGSFAGLGGTSATLTDVNLWTDPVGSSFSPSTFMSFDSAPNLPSLDVNFISGGVFGVNPCAPPYALPQSCTPASAVGRSSIGPISQRPMTTFTFSGVTGDGLSTWNANFTVPFTSPFQTMLTDLATSGSFTTGYSATINVNAVGVPEPQTAVMLVLGMALVAISRLRLIRPR